MSCKQAKSTPIKLKQFYNIPDRNADIPIKIGIYESLDQYLYKQDCIDFINNYGMKGVPANFDYVINNNMKFVGNDNSVIVEAVWNKGEYMEKDNSIIKAGGEASLDIQIILGVCEIGLNKGDEIYIYNQSRSSLNDIKIGYSPFFTYLHNNTKSDIPKIWSISYGGDEIANRVPSGLIDTVNKLSKNDYQIFIASGDGGSSGCRGNYSGDIRPSEPAVFPNITAVGGTNIITCDNQYMEIEIPSVFSYDDCTLFSAITSGGGMDGVYTNKSNEAQPIIPYFTDINEEPILELQRNIVKEYITDLESNSANVSYTNPELIENIKNFYNEKSFYPRAYPDISGSSEYYIVYKNGSSEILAGTSAATPLNASMYAIIMSNLGNNNHGKFNEYIYKAYNSENMKVFNPVYSICAETDSNKNAKDSCSKGSLTYGWGVSKNRLWQNSSKTGYGFDCVVGLGSINATELQNYISSSITPTKSGISSINIKGNQLQIKYV